MSSAPTLAGTSVVGRALRCLGLCMVALVSLGASSITDTRLEYWPNGQVRLEAHLRHDRFHGSYLTYYASGQPFEVRHYVQGREEGRQQSFTETGDLFLNYDVWQGRRYGFLNARPCLPVASPGK
jgi:hypothetical protein